jgi:hypothetical protein
VKAGYIVGNDAAKSRSAVRLGIPTEVGVVRRNQWDTRAPRGGLTEASDHELRCAVHQIGLEFLNCSCDASVRGNRQADVRIGRKCRAGKLHVQVGGSEIVDELFYAPFRLAWIAGSDYTHLPSAGAQPRDSPRGNDRHPVHLRRIGVRAVEDPLCATVS